MAACRVSMTCSGLPARRRHWGSLLAALALSCLQCITATDPSSLSSATHIRARALHQEWAKAYELDSTFPPEQVVLGKKGLKPPKAPHLQECVALDGLRRAEELYPERGGYPEWACVEDDLGTPRIQRLKPNDPNKYVLSPWKACSHPATPWIEGRDEDNLPLTRAAQRDIWLHQFPPDCTRRGTRFLVVSWPWLNGDHGLGSQLHLVSIMLSIALAHGRILVESPGSFHPANHSACHRMGAKGSIACYFRPLSSRQCFVQAMKLYKRQSAQDKEFTDFGEMVKSDIPVVWVPLEENIYRMQKEARATKLWRLQYQNMNFSTFGLLGNTILTSKRDHIVKWWRSQSIRFFLRWQSAFMCHILNRARHNAYGLDVARRVAAADIAVHRLEEALPSLTSDTAQSLKKLGERVTAMPLEDSREVRISDQAFVPRPIMSMFIRRGDKGAEMKLFSLEYFMWLAERIRRMNPEIETIFVSTGSQAVIDELKNDYKDWTFIYNKIPWKGGTKAAQHEQMVGLEAFSANLLANLVMAAECDYFVGALASNWDRMLNELRMTGGRLQQVYMSVNHVEY